VIVFVNRLCDQHRHRRHRRYHRGDDELFVDASPRHAQRIVKTVTERTAERTGNDDFQKISSHDLRRYFAHGGGAEVFTDLLLADLNCISV
jgi:hypothetical protein